MGCPWCHEDSTPYGMLPDLSIFLKYPFYESIHPFTEMAIGGGNVFESKDLIFLLEKNLERNIISNLTVNQTHAEEHAKQLKEWLSDGLVKGLGISFNNASKLNPLIDKLDSENIVIHLIAGGQSFNKTILDALKDKKILFLGYKDIRRGKDFKNNNSKMLCDNLSWLNENIQWFTDNTEVLSFDSLAVKQLNAKSLLDLDDKTWNSLFQGYDEDNTLDENNNILCSTMFVDYPNMLVARSSSSPCRSFLNPVETISETFRRNIHETLQGKRI